MQYISQLDALSLNLSRDITAIQSAMPRAGGGNKVATEAPTAQSLLPGLDRIGRNPRERVERVVKNFYYIESEFKGFPWYAHPILLVTHPRRYIPVLKHVLSKGRILQLLRQYVSGQIALSERGWQDAALANPSFVESVKINATNYNREETVPVDMAGLRRRTG